MNHPFIALGFVASILLGFFHRRLMRWGRVKLGMKPKLELPPYATPGTKEWADVMFFNGFISQDEYCTFYRNLQAKEQSANANR